MTDHRDISFEDARDIQKGIVNSTAYPQYTRDPQRTPFQWDDTPMAGFTTAARAWLPIHPNSNVTNLKAQQEAVRSTFKLYKSMIEFRKTSEVLKNGNFESKALGDKVYGAMRTLIGHDTIAVFINLGDATKVSLKELLDYYNDSEFTDKIKATVLFATTESPFNAGSQIPDVQSIDLMAGEGIVLAVSSSTKLAVSMLLLFCALIKFVF